MLCSKILSKYWGVSKGIFCYENIFILMSPYNLKESESQKDIERSFVKRLRDEDFGSSSLGKLRKWCWNLTEYPETSLLARVIPCMTLLNCNIFPLPGICLHLHGSSYPLHRCICAVYNARADWWDWYDPCHQHLWLWCRVSNTNREMGGCKLLISTTYVYVYFFLLLFI